MRAGIRARALTDNVAQYFNNALADAVDRLIVPDGDYLLNGTGAQLLLRTQPINLQFQPAARLLLHRDVPATTDVLRLLPPSGGATQYLIDGLSIRPADGPIVVSGATNASPIILSVASAPLTGTKVYVYDVGGNAAANGFRTVTRIDGTHVSLDGSGGSGAYTSGGAMQIIPARHGLHIDCTTDDLYKSEFERMNIQNVSGCGIYAGNPAARRDGGLFTSTIRESYFGNCQGAAGIHLDRTGDSIHIIKSTFFGDELGILLDSITGAHGFMLTDANSSSLKGMIKILSGDSATIYGGDLEVTVATSTGTPEPAIIHIAGRAGAPVTNTLIDARYLGVATIQRAIKVDYAQDTHIRSVQCDIGYGPGTAGSNEMIHLTVNAVNTVIGEHVTFGGNAPPSRNFLDESATTKYPPNVAPQGNSIAQRDASGSLQASSLSARYGALGTYGNLVFKPLAFENAGWNKAGGSISASAGTSPTGASDARKLVEDSSTGLHLFYQNQGVTSSGEVLWFSVFAKASSRTQLRLVIYDGGANGGQANFDLTTGNVIGSSVFGTVASGSLQAYSVPYANGWYRLITSVKSVSFADIYCQVALQNAGSASYAGDGTSGALVWGASLSRGQLSVLLKTQFPVSQGLVVSPLDPAAQSYLDGPLLLTGPVVSRNAEGTTSETIQCGATQGSMPLKIYLDASGAFMSLVAATGELSFQNGLRMFWRDSTGVTIPVLGVESDDAFYVGFRGVTATNGHLVFCTGGPTPKFPGRFTPAGVFLVGTGSPLSTEIARFNGTVEATGFSVGGVPLISGNLTGDVTTSGSSATTISSSGMAAINAALGSAANFATLVAAVKAALALGISDVSGLTAALAAKATAGGTTSSAGTPAHTHTI